MKCLWLLVVCTILFPLLTWASVNESIRNIPVDVEGVYKAKNHEGSFFYISLLQNMVTKQITVTVSSQGGRILFFSTASNIFSEGETEIVVSAFNVDFKGVRKYVSFVVNPEEETVKGTVSANFLETDEDYILKGKKESSLKDILSKEENISCPENKDLEGLYKGHFGSASQGDEELRLRLIPDETGELRLTAYVRKRAIKFLYHDGFVSKSLGLLSLVSDSSYSFTGKSRKLMLLCGVSEGQLILKGLHISSTGRVIKNIEFKKVQKK